MSEDAGRSKSSTPADNGDSTSSATAESGGSKSSTSTDWAAASRQVRDVADWVIKAFVALATLLIGTGPLLVNLADLRFDVRGLIAVSGAVVALIAVGSIIWMATDVKLTEVTDVIDLVDPRSRDKEATERLLDRISANQVAKDLYLFGEDDVTALLSVRDGQLAMLSAYADEVSSTSDPSRRKQLEQQDATARANIATFDASIRDLEGWATYEEVRARFEAKRPWIFVAAGFVAVGVTVWLAALGIDPSSEADDPAGSSAGTPVTGGVVGLLTWSTTDDDGQPVDELRARLGMTDVSCDEVGVIVEGGTGDALNPWQVAVLPNDDCPVEPRFTLDRRFATFTDFEPSEVERVEVELKAQPWWSHVQTWVFVAIGALVGAVIAISILPLRTGRGRRRGASTSDS